MEAEKITDRRRSHDGDREIADAVDMAEKLAAYHEAVARGDEAWPSEKLLGLA